MTVQDLAKALYRDMGVTVLTPANATDNTNTRGPSTGDPETVLSAIHTALAELWREAPNTLFQRRYGTVLRAPVTVSVAVTQYSTAATITTWAAWMEGCAIRLTGDVLDNEIEHQNVLVRPYMGATGTVSGTVHADCVPFTESNQTGLSGINTVLPPVWLVGYNELLMAGDRKDFMWRSNLFNNRGQYATPQTVSVGTASKFIGTPTLCFVDTVNRSGSAYTTYLRVNPMPPSDYLLEFNALIAPPVYTLAMIDNGDHLSDPGTDIILPFPESFLLPVARQCLSGDSRFVNLSGKDEIARQYKKAIASLGDLRPTTQTVTPVAGNPIFRGR